MILTAPFPEEKAVRHPARKLPSLSFVHSQVLPFYCHLYCLPGNRKDSRGAESELLKKELRVTSHYTVKFREQQPLVYLRPEGEVML